MDNESKTLNCLVVGAPGVGKSAWLTRHLRGTFSLVPEPLASATLSFETSVGPLQFQCWEANSLLELSDLASMCPRIDGVVLIFNRNDWSSYEAIPAFLAAIRDHWNSIPVVLCGNQVDRANLAIKSKDLRLHRELDLIYYDMSAKSNYNYEKPWLYLARQCLEAPTLRFGQATPL